MHEDPLPDMDPNGKFYAGDNQYRVSGQALEFKQLNVHAWEAFDKGHDVHMQAAPSQAELLYKNFKINKDKLKSHIKDTIMEKYGAATDEVLPRELLLGQSEKEETALPKSKYEEDAYINNRTSVWVTSAANRRLETAIVLVLLLMNTGLDSEIVYLNPEAPAQAEEKRLATWGSEVPDDLVLDDKKTF
ncbi:hypothetical protein RD792_005484 [Penstemon davidsonii]|uniref:Pre-mRNA-splicing factor SLU7 n=1 Tax=Penstemon davidsonii TaxID=160366 RepID=A0ABR0DLE1_9LAMI|nr:hypothetical protein RD792_005484 [Penstemon davidsonii]